MQTWKKPSVSLAFLLEPFDSRKVKLWNHTARGGTEGTWSSGASRQVLGVCHVLLKFWWQQLLLLTYVLMRSHTLPLVTNVDSWEMGWSVDVVLHLLLSVLTYRELSDTSCLPNTSLLAKGVHTFVYPFNKQSLHTYYLPWSVWGTGCAVVSTSDVAHTWWEDSASQRRGQSANV